MQSGQRGEFYRPLYSLQLEHAGLFLREVSEAYNLGFEGLFEADRQKLRKARDQQRKIQRWSNIIAANVFKVFRLLQWQAVETTQLYAETISSLQEISESVRDIVVRAKQHVANNHSGLLDDQIAELERVRQAVTEILDRAAHDLVARECTDCDVIAAKNRELRMMVNDFDHKQIKRIQGNQSKTRLSILFYSLVWDSLKITEQTTYLLNVFQESLQVAESNKKNGDTTPGIEPDPVTT